MPVISGVHAEQLPYKYIIGACRKVIISSSRVLSHIGSGQFGNVSNGTWKTATGVLEVAVKTLVAGASKMDKVKFLQEAAIMAQFRHPNIVFLHGVVGKEEPVSEIANELHKLCLCCEVLSFIFLAYVGDRAHA